MTDHTAAIKALNDRADSSAGYAALLDSDALGKEAEARELREEAAAKREEVKAFRQAAATLLTVSTNGQEG